MHYREGERWGLCKEPGASSSPASGALGGVPVGAQDLESLSYVPARFDESPTIDVERSHARYSKIVGHSMRAKMQRRSKAWEDWLRAAVAGRSITLLSGFTQATERAAEVAVERIAAWYALDRTLTKLSILPDRDVEMSPIPIMVDNIQVICPAGDFLLLLDQVDSLLDDSEKSRAVLLQYVTEDSERRRICFLEESVEAKDHCVQALTSLWLEKRNEHSMWF